MQQKTRVLIIGASGKLGTELIKCFDNPDLKLRFEVFGTYNSCKTDGLEFLDITKKDIVKITFEKIKPEIVILPAALTYAEYCEEQPDLAYEINVEGTKNVVELCKHNNCKLIFLSSDYVFDGNAGPYSEESNTNPLNLFGKTKVQAEEIVRKLEDHVIIRTAWVNDLNPNSKSYVMQIINSLKENRKVIAPIDQFGHPTLSNNICDVITELILKNKKGIFHVTGSTFVSRYELAIEIAKAFGLNSSLIEGVESSQLNQKATRPKKVQLELTKIKSEISTKILSLKEQLEIMRSQYTYDISIKGVKLIPVGQHTDQRGSLSVLASKGRSDAPNVKEIQEVYISTSPELGTIRAEHKHERLDEYFIILDGSAKFVLVDDRKNSPSFQQKNIFFLYSKYPFALFVPSEIYHAFITLEKNTRCLALSNLAYDKNEPDALPASRSVFGNSLTVDN